MAAAKSLQLYLTLCDPIHSSPLGSSVPGILQARILEWVAISFSNAWKWKVKVKSLSHAWLLATPWTAAYQAPPGWIFQARVLKWSAIAFSGKEWQDILKVMKEKNLQPRLLHPARISFKYEGEIKSFTDEQKLREFSTTKSVLRQMLKDIL